MPFAHCQQRFDLAGDALQFAERQIWAKALVQLNESIGHRRSDAQHHIRWPDCSPVLTPCPGYAVRLPAYAGVRPGPPQGAPEQVTKREGAPQRQNFLAKSTTLDPL